MANDPAKPIAPRFTLGGDNSTGNGMDDRFTDPSYWEGSLGKRLVAYLIDIVVLWLIGAGLGLIMFLSLGLLAPITTMLWVVTPVLYHTIMVSQRGATVGQRFAGLRIVDATTGNVPSVIQAFLLTCLFYISVSLAFLPLLYVLFDPRDRFLHDLFSNTRSIRAEPLTS